LTLLELGSKMSLVSFMARVVNWSVLAVRHFG
jgi:hypothetical protein